MLTVGNLLIFAGYTLIYAACANRGIMATDPWLGLFTDAYSYQPGDATSVPSSPGPSPSQRRRQDRRAGPLSKSLIPQPAPYPGS